MKEFTVKFYDEDITVSFIKGSYETNGRLYIGCISKNEDGEWEEFCDVTKNLPDEIPKKFPLDQSSFFDEKGMPECIYTLFFKNEWLYMLGEVARSGFNSYPLVFFEREFLDDICTELEE